jgi:hypothetical protein
MNRRELLATALLAAALQGPALAATVDGYSFEDQARVADADLLLNGVGFRGVRIFKAYSASLYLTHKSEQPAQVLAMPGPKRLRIRMLWDVPSVEFAKAFELGVTRNTAASELPALKERMATFDAMVRAIGKVRKGDVVDLDLVPGQGLVFMLNGKPRGEPIAGADLYAALLRIFIGDLPVDDRLKAGLLGGTLK